MQQLYDQLVAGEVEYKDNGVLLRHAPSSTALRAARAIKQLLDVNTTNTGALLKAQQEIDELHTVLNIKTIKITQLENEIDSIHEDRRKASELESRGNDTPGGDSTSEGGIQPEGANPSTD